MLIALMVLSVAIEPEVVRTAPAGTGAVPMAAEAESPALPALPAAPETPTHDMTTAQQIDRWLSGPPVDLAYSPHDMLPPERRVRGEVSAAVGTGGYRELGVRVEGPIGENGWGAIVYQERRF